MEKGVDRSAAVLFGSVTPCYTNSEEMTLEGAMGELGEKYRQFVGDFRSGMTKSQLMGTYGLLAPQLERLLERMVRNRILRAPEVEAFLDTYGRSEAESSPEKRRINVREFVADFRSGVPKSRIAVKHGLFPTQLDAVLAQMVTAGHLEAGEAEAFRSFDGQVVVWSPPESPAADEAKQPKQDAPRPAEVLPEGDTSGSESQDPWWESFDESRAKGLLGRLRSIAEIWVEEAKGRSKIRLTIALIGFLFTGDFHYVDELNLRLVVYVVTVAATVSVFVAHYIFPSREQQERAASEYWYQKEFRHPEYGGGRSTSDAREPSPVDHSAVCAVLSRIGHQLEIDDPDAWPRLYEEYSNALRDYQFHRLDDNERYRLYDLSVVLEKLSTGDPASTLRIRLRELKDRFEAGYCP